MAPVLFIPEDSSKVWKKVCVLMSYCSGEYSEVGRYSALYSSPLNFSTFCSATSWKWNVLNDNVLNLIASLANAYHAQPVKFDGQPLLCRVLTVPYSFNFCFITNPDWYFSLTFSQTACFWSLPGTLYL